MNFLWKIIDIDKAASDVIEDRLKQDAVSTQTHAEFLGMEEGWNIFTVQLSFKRPETEARTEPIGERE